MEQRLLEHKKQYEANQEARKKERLLEEMGQMRESPLINQRSELIAQSASTQQMKVEDRLLGIGKVWKEKKVKQS